jgi:hypothetical protein
MGKIFQDYPKNLKKKLKIFIYFIYLFLNYILDVLSLEFLIAKLEYLLK